MAQLRKAADRSESIVASTRRARCTTPAELPLIENGAPETNGSSVRTIAGIEVQGDGPMVVRESFIQRCR